MVTFKFQTFYYISNLCSVILEPLQATLSLPYAFMGQKPARALGRDYNLGLLLCGFLLSGSLLSVFRNTVALRYAFWFFRSGSLQNFSKNYSHFTHRKCWPNFKLKARRKKPHTHTVPFFFNKCQFSS